MSNDILIEIRIPKNLMVGDASQGNDAARKDSEVGGS